MPYLFSDKAKCMKIMASTVYRCGAQDCSNFGGSPSTFCPPYTIFAL